MVALPVWISSWVCECCGVPRRLGETVDLELTFTGEVVASAEPDRVYAAGSTGGTLSDILWRPALRREVGDRSFVIDGYGPATRLNATSDWPDDGDGGWALELILEG
jgi:hypothetical protein